MKTRLFFAALLLLAFGTVKAQNEADQINIVRVLGSGDVYVSQTPGQLSLKKEGKIVTDYNRTSDMLILSGSDDYEVTISQLKNIQLLSSADVVCKSTITGDYINVYSSGSGDMVMKLDYDTVHVVLNGSGDIILEGRCNVLQAILLGSGDLVTDGMKAGDSFIDLRGSREARGGDDVSLSELMAELGTNLERLSDSVDWKNVEKGMEQWGKDMEEWGRKMEKWGERFEYKQGGNYDRPRSNDRPAPDQNRRPEKKNLLFDGNWNGFEAGLNMLLGPGSTANFEGDYSFLELRPLRSWVFNFNIADVGIAFDRRHIAGLYTGVGLGWNNYSFNKPIKVVKGDTDLEYEPLDAATWRRSKLGVLYVQAPLMIEVRPTRRLYIAAGVTGGLRIDGWTKVKFQNGDKVKVHSDYYLNRFKLDASLRIGKNDGWGFFANFNLLPTFDEAHAPTCHTTSFGFSLNF